METGIWAVWGKCSSFSAVAQGSKELTTLSWMTKEQGPAKQVLSLKFVCIIFVSSLRQDFIGKMINFLQDFSCLAVIDVIRAVPANMVSRTGEIVGTSARNNSSKCIKAICTFSLVTKECTSSCKWNTSTPPCFPGSVHSTLSQARGVCHPGSQVAPLDASGNTRGHSQQPHTEEGVLEQAGHLWAPGLAPLLPWLSKQLLWLSRGGQQQGLVPSLWQPCCGVSYEHTFILTGQVQWKLEAGK